MAKYAIIDFLRGYSIFTIVLMHLVGGMTFGIFSKAVAFGGAGVHVFILCSGFGLYLSYLRKPLNYLDFLKKRFGRIWIPYAVAVILWGVWMLVSEGEFPQREVLAHLLLYKMFSSEFDISLCYPYWFISTIIQFYIAWPLIVKVFRLHRGGLLLLAISLLWSTLVGILGLEDNRAWGSFFLQYLWEFGLGMWIAEKCMSENWTDKIVMDINYYRWYWLLVGVFVGMGLSALMAWDGGFLKLYNDIPSLVGYISLALLIYKVGIDLINSFFEWANSFSYELYLMHSLVFTVIAYLIASKLPAPFLFIISLITAYIIGFVYMRLLKKTRLVK